MSEPDLQSYLDAERAEGQFAGSGVFGIDFERAMIQQSGYSLPQPGLWAIRVIQGMIRLGATGVSVTQSPSSLRIRATLRDELPQTWCLRDIFRTQGDSDPRFPLQAGLLAGLGRRYQMEMHWSDDQQRMTMSLGQGQAAIRPGTQTLPLPAIEVLAKLPRRGILARLFGKADFSPEFHEVSRRTFLAPVPVTLDQRPCDFSTGFALHFYPALEFRGVRATSGPRLLLLPSTARGLERPALDANRYYRPLGTGGYAFVLSLGWSGQKPRMSTAAWIRDGVIVDEEPLFPDPSPLSLTLFLPADELPTDLTGMALLKTSEREQRLQEARLWATTSLKTHAPPIPLSAEESKDSVAERLLSAVEERMSQALEACHYTKGEIRNFQDAIEAHLFQHEAEQRQAQKASKEREQHRNKKGWSELEQRQQESLARWGRFLSYTPPIDESVYSQSQNPQSPKPLKVAQFFGEVYVQLPRSVSE